MAGEGLDTTPLPALLRGAWRTYVDAVRGAMADAGFDDLPRNGAYVVGAIAGAGLPLGRVVDQLGVSKQAAGQLVDALVLRGYLDRVPDPTDRRRLTISLTARGEAAAAVARRAIAEVDDAVRDRVGA
ncbi:MAG TPA: MarR family transcriptional regulator, partial [Acidimicrobiales bacterium]|nr:MarR family transcriptional regulator [Acidimicrobiales bacterium]